MPTYRSITTELHSQYDADTLPEYFPHPETYYTRRGITAHVPPAINKLTSTCSVYIPVFPSSQFWISYSVSPPVPDDQMYFFKLFINDNHIVSWSCGKNEGWKGKTMFGLFTRVEEDGRKIVEKRVLSFSSPDGRGEWTGVEDALDESAYLEIKVHRAHRRRRIAREAGVQEYATTEHAKCEKGIELINAGRVGGGHPKRYYTFGLIDPLDHPFVAFRYYYRTWAQIQYLGLLDEDSEFSEEVAPEPMKTRRTSPAVHGSNLHDALTGMTLNDDGRALTSPAHVFINTDSRDLDIGHSSNRTSLGQEQQCSRAQTLSQFHRLSVPPSLKLDPPYSLVRDLPSIPQKKDSISSTGYRPHPAYPVEEWIRRTPSPVKSIRDGISTPPLFKRRGFTGMSLINVVASAWKRRGPSSEQSNETESRAASRNRDIS